MLGPEKEITSTYFTCFRIPQGEGKPPIGAPIFLAIFQKEKNTYHVVLILSTSRPYKHPQKARNKASSQSLKIAWLKTQLYFSDKEDFA